MNDALSVICPHCLGDHTSLQVVDSSDSAIDRNGVAVADLHDNLYSVVCDTCGFSGSYRDSRYVPNAQHAFPRRLECDCATTSAAVRKAVYGVNVHAEREVLRPEILVAALLSLLAVGGLDHYTGSAVSVATFYLIPVGISAWSIGRHAGLLCCGLAALTRLVANHTTSTSFMNSFWNAGMLFGVLLAFTILISELRALGKVFPFERIFRRTVVIGIGVAVAAAGLGRIADRVWSREDSAQAAAVAPAKDGGS